MLDLNELSLNSPLYLLGEKEEIFNTLNLKRFLKTRFKKSLLMVTAAVGLVSVFGSVGCAGECKGDPLYLISGVNTFRNTNDYGVPLRFDWMVSEGNQQLSEQECRYYINNVQKDSECSCRPGPNSRDLHSFNTYDKALFNVCKFYLELLDAQRATDQWKGEVGQRIDADNQRVDTALQTLTETFTEQLNGHIQILKSAQDTLKMDINTVDRTLKTAVANAAEQLDLKDQDIKTRLLHMNQSFYEALATAQNASNIRWQEITNQLDTRLQHTETRLSVKNEPTVTLPFLMGAFFTGMAGVKFSTHWVPLNDAATASGCFVPQNYLHAAYGLYAISTLALEQATWNVVAPLVPHAATDFTHGSVFLLSAGALYGLHQSGERIAPHLTLRNSLLLSGLGIVGAYTFQDYVCMFLPCWISNVLPEGSLIPF